MLKADRDADKDLADDKSVHILCNGTNDAADECNDATNNEEPCWQWSAYCTDIMHMKILPSSPKDIGQLADHEENDSAEYDIG